MESSACCRCVSDAEQSAWSYSMTPECAPVRLKEEPSWGECGVSEAAAAEGLYAAHEVKDELVIGPEQIQQQDIAFSMQTDSVRQLEDVVSISEVEDGTTGTPKYTYTCPGDGPGGNGSTEQQHGLRSCYVRLQQLREGNQRSNYYALNKTAEDPCKLEPADGAAPECPHTRPGEGPQCNMSHEHQSKLRNCFVRLERILVEDLPSCNTCLKTFDCKASLNNYSCPKTGRLSNYSTNVSKSQGRKPSVLASHTSEKKSVFKSDVCVNGNKRFRYLCDLAKHKTVRSGDMLFSCSVCNKQFTSLCSLNKHMRLHTDKKLYSCDVCKKRFIWEHLLTYHMRTHTGKKPFACDVCKSQFSQKHDLARHIRTHTREKPFTCDVCNSQFSQKSTLAVHTRTHTGEKPFTCDVCKTQFRSTGNLIEHRRTHTGEKPFACDVCKSQFSQKHNLARHIQSHTGVKHFTCEVCNSQFYRKSHLVQHRRTHTGEKPFTCEVCNSQFSQISHLTSHIRTHTGEKPFSCDVCKTQFRSRSHLIEHRRTHTGEKP